MRADQALSTNEWDSKTKTVRVESVESVESVEGSVGSKSRESGRGIKE